MPGTPTREHGSIFGQAMFQLQRESPLTERERQVLAAAASAASIAEIAASLFLSEGTVRN